jgi:3-hydroxybutyryl-CoA dehydrogenase
MKIIVVADIDMQKEFESKGIPEGVEVHFETSVSNVNSSGDAYFYLLDESGLANDIESFRTTNAPFFVNAVVTTLDDLPGNAVRINAWPTFLQRPITEVCTSKQNEDAAVKILEALNWNHQIVPDVKGMVAAKVISMIINEAFFALGDDVSSREHIDTAMKLGTNYPYGPFEWSEKIGLNNIHRLLTSLSSDDKRYEPAPLLTKEISA